MSKKIPDPPTATWEFFLAARQVLGLVALQRIFGNRSTSQLYRWARNPAYTADSERNPLDWLASTFRALREQGLDEISLAGLAILAEAAGARVVLPEPEAAGDSSVQVLAVDAYKSVGDMLDQARKGADPKAVELLAAEAVRRVQVLATAYRAGFENGGAVRFRAGASEQETREVERFLGRARAHRAHRGIRGLLGRLLGRVGRDLEGG